MCQKLSCTLRSGCTMRWCGGTSGMLASESRGAMLTTMGLKLACQHLLSAAEACMLQDRPLEHVQPAAKRVQVSLMRSHA